MFNLTKMPTVVGENAQIVTFESKPECTLQSPKNVCTSKKMDHQLN